MSGARTNGASRTTSQGDGRSDEATETEWQEIERELADDQPTVPQTPTALRRAAAAARPGSGGRAAA